MLRFAIPLIHLFFLVSFESYGGEMIGKNKMVFFDTKHYLLKVEDASKISSLFTKMDSQYFGKLKAGVFGAEIGSRYGRKIFFDFEHNELHKSCSELSLTKYENLPEYRRDKIKIQFKDCKEKKYGFESKKYNKKLKAEDKHLLIGKIKRKEREHLKELLLEVTNIDLLLLKKSIDITFHDVVYEVSHYGNVYGSVTLRQFSFSSLGVSNTFILLRLEVSEEEKIPLTLSESNALKIAFLDLDTDVRKLVANEALVENFGYSEYYKLKHSIVPLAHLAREESIGFRLFQVLILSGIGWFCLFLLFRMKVAFTSYSLRDFRQNEK